ncbi:MAG: DNA recombination protein RmuC [Oscillospiraceae bacterium]|nr:DNA recombination protein RmuC [Oscillospiraceae bacterium]
MQWILLILCALLVAVTVVQGRMLLQLWDQMRYPENSENSENPENQQFALQEEKLEQMNERLTEQLDRMDFFLKSSSRENDDKFLNVQVIMQRNFQMMEEEMRSLMDEKMQDVLDIRFQQAFSAVNLRLEQVHRGLGEMQALAGSVGDLKKVFSNVKLRGEVGEIQLEAILSDFLSEKQYMKNVMIGKGQVEFAVRMPDRNGRELLLPVDSKFPADTYRNLLDACESGDKNRIATARKQFANRIRSEAKDISEKYLHPPLTTDFGILFFPTENLYTEVLQSGLQEELFRKYRIFVTSPSTLTALLVSLQAGFQSIVIQKQSAEIQALFEEIREEFDKFTDALTRTQDRISSASDELEQLVGVRTRQLHRKLHHVQDYLTEEPSVACENYHKNHENKKEPRKIKISKKIKKI